MHSFRKTCQDENAEHRRKDEKEHTKYPSHFTRASCDLRTIWFNVTLLTKISYSHISRAVTLRTLRSRPLHFCGQNWGIFLGNRIAGVNIHQIKLVVYSDMSGPKRPIFIFEQLKNKGLLSISIPAFIPNLWMGLIFLFFFVKEHSISNCSKSNQFSFYIQESRSHCGLCNLYSGRHPLSSDPRSE